MASEEGNDPVDQEAGSNKVERGGRRPSRSGRDSEILFEWDVALKIVLHPGVRRPIVLPASSQTGGIVIH